MPKRIRIDNIVHTFPDDFTDEDIQNALDSVKKDDSAQRPGESRYQYVERVTKPDQERLQGEINKSVEPYKEIGRGTKQAFTAPTGEEKAKGVHRAIGGAMEAAGPVMAATAPLNPIGTAVGLGTGMAASYLAKKGATAVGVPEGYADVIGDVAGLGAGGFAAKKATGKRFNPTEEQIEALRLKRSSEPEDLMVKGIKPRATNVGFRESLKRSMPEIKASEDETGKTAEDVGSLLETVQHAKRRVWGQYAEIMGPRAKNLYDMSPVADAMTATIDDRTLTQNPARADAIRKTADTYRRPMSLQQAEDYLHHVNAELEAYFNKYPTAQRKAVAKNPDIAGLVAEGESLRSRIYGALDEESEGKIPAELKRRYGSLLNLEEELYRRKNVADRQQPDSLSQQVGKVRAVGHIARGLFSGNIADTAMGAAEIAAANWLKDQQTTDALIRRSLKNYEGRPAPLGPPRRPPAGLLPVGTAPFTQGTVVPDILGRPGRTTGYMIEAPPLPQPLRSKGQPGTAPLVTPPPPPPSDLNVLRTTTGPTPQQNVNALMQKILTPSRPALPPGTAPFTQGTVVPEILGKPGQTTGHLLEPPPRPTQLQGPSFRGTGIRPIVPSQEPGTTVRPAPFYVDVNGKKIYLGTGTSEPPQ